MAKWLIVQENAGKWDLFNVESKESKFIPLDPNYVAGQEIDLSEPAIEQQSEIVQDAQPDSE